MGNEHARLVMIQHHIATMEEHVRRLRDAGVDVCTLNAIETETEKFTTFLLDELMQSGHVIDERVR